MDFGILGPLEAASEGRLIKVGGPRQQTVLAMLLLEAGKVISVDRLLDAREFDVRVHEGRQALAEGDAAVAAAHL